MIVMRFAIERAARINMRPGFFGIREQGDLGGRALRFRFVECEFGGLNGAGKWNRHTDIWNTQQVGRVIRRERAAAGFNNNVAVCNAIFQLYTMAAQGIADGSQRIF